MQHIEGAIALSGTVLGVIWATTQAGKSALIEIQRPVIAVKVAERHNLQKQCFKTMDTPQNSCNSRRTRLKVHEIFLAGTITFR